MLSAIVQKELEVVVMKFLADNYQLFWKKAGRIRVARMKTTLTELEAIRNMTKKMNQKVTLKQVVRNLLRELLKELHLPAKKRMKPSTKRIRLKISYVASASRQRQRRCNLVVRIRKKGFNL